ncbi:MAG: alpha/beta hydrolase [Chloroflexi bacterium HGW-Chloroflexi-10]|nr:MAG: alpha/beta hydrolase [Chloroflexi bacterium HGW-Chloroflexi-10]
MAIMFILILVVVIILAIAFFFAAQVIYPKRFGYEETYEIEVSKGRIDPLVYELWKKEELQIISPHGYKLNALFFPAADSKRGVILSHGITYTLFGSVKYMYLFRDLGFNILIYDSRHHGRSGGRNVTFGHYEKEDLKTVVDWMRQRLGTDCVVGTHGESMGAAITMQHAAMDPDLAFVIEDCGFSDLQTLLAYRLRADYHLGRFPMLPLAGWICRMLTGMRFEAICPREAVEKIPVPVLFIHGQEDDYIPPQMALELYEHKKNGAREMYLAPNAGHAGAYWNNQVEYAARVEQFLRNNGII